jgi:hypothetical protein
MNSKKIKTLIVLSLCVLMTACAVRQPQDSDPVSALNPPAQEMRIYQQYGIKTVGDWKAVVLEMKDSGYISQRDSSYLVMLDYLKDREVARKTPGMTALDVRKQREQVANEAKIQKKLSDQKILNALFTGKWSIDDLPCNLNGGTYRRFGESFPRGEQLFMNGKITDTNQRVFKRFTVNDDGTITNYYEIYAHGNNLMEKLMGSQNAIVSATSVRYRIEGNKLYSESVDKSVDLDSLLKRQGTKYKTRTNKSVSSRCPS